MDANTETQQLPGATTRGTIPTPVLTEEMIRERETVHLKAEERANALRNQASPPVVVDITKEMVFGWCKHFGISVMDADSSHGGVIAQMEQRIEVLEGQLLQSRDDLEAAARVHAGERSAHADTLSELKKYQEAAAVMPTAHLKAEPAS